VARDLQVTIWCTKCEHASIEVATALDHRGHRKVANVDYDVEAPESSAGLCVPNCRFGPTSSPSDRKRRTEPRHTDPRAVRACTLAVHRYSRARGGRQQRSPDLRHGDEHDRARAGAGRARRAFCWRCNGCRIAQRIPTRDQGRGARHRVRRCPRERAQDCHCNERRRAARFHTVDRRPLRPQLADWNRLPD
jgi:hypothetical protein